MNILDQIQPILLAILGCGGLWKAVAVYNQKQHDKKIMENDNSSESKHLMKDRIEKLEKDFSVSVAELKLLSADFLELSIESSADKVQIEYLKDNNKRLEDENAVLKMQLQVKG